MKFEQKTSLTPLVSRQTNYRCKKLNILDAKLNDTCAVPEPNKFSGTYDLFSGTRAIHLARLTRDYKRRKWNGTFTLLRKPWRT